MWRFIKPPHSSNRASHFKLSDDRHKLTWRQGRKDYYLINSKAARELRHIQHFTNGRERPVDRLLVDHQWRGKAHDVLMGFLGQNALLLQCLTKATCPAGFRLQFNADQESFSAHFLY